MQILSRCPLRVGSILWLPRPGAYAMTVVCKATFRLAPEVSPLADEQEPVIEADVYPGDDESKSLALPSDLVPFKRQPEILLVGHAYAPQGVHVGRLVARLTIVEVDKAIEITGDRHFKLDGSLSHPARFAKMPLSWERAAGGLETSNPIGVPMGPEARPDGWGRVPVPNLVPLNRLISDRDDVVPPACFAPVSPRWPTRLARLHRYAVGFAHQAWHALPLPADFDPGYFNAAPQDQQVHELAGTERFTLENLHPQYPLLTTHLEGVKPRAHVDFGGGAAKFEIPLACDTLLIDTDRGVACLTFRGSMALDYPERAGWVVVTMDGHQPPAREPLPSRVETREPLPSRVEMREPPPGRVETREPPLPSVARSPLPPPPPVAREPAPRRGEGLPGWMDGVKEVHETVAFDGDESQAAALPFLGDAAIAFEETGDLDDAETFASDDSRGVPPPRGPSVAVAPGAAPLPPAVPKGPRLGAFRLVSPSESPPAATGAGVPPEVARASALDDAPTVDPDEIWLHETADDPSTVRPALQPGVPAPPVPGAPLPPIAGRAAPVPPPPVAGPAPIPPPPPVAGLGPPPAGAPVVPRKTATWSDAGPLPSAVLPFASPAGEGPRRAPGEVADRSVLPFAQAAPGDDTAARMGPAAGLPFAAAASAQLGPSPGMTIGERVAQARAPVVAPVAPIEAPPSFDPEPTADVAPGEALPPPPPARIGPLATPEMVAADLGVPVEAPPPAVGEGAPEASGAAAAAGAEEPEPLPLEEYPLERCARIAASIARTREKLPQILEAHELEEEVWEALKAHWAAEIKMETERGKTAMLRAYDAAYVAQLEEERGPIAVEEYARMVVASERGTAPRTLAELGLPESSMLRIQRVWMGKTQKDPELRRLVRAAVEQASEE